MTGIDQKKYEELESDFNKILSKGQWKAEDYCTMKDIQKILYYIDVRKAMQEGEGYPGSEYMPDGMSFRRGRNSVNGQYMSRDMGGSGTYYPPYMDENSWDNRGSYNGGRGGNGSGNRYYDGMGMSGRRYYDSEKEKALHKLHHMMENTDDAERKNALKLAINELEMSNH